MKTFIYENYPFIAINFFSMYRVIRRTIIFAAMSGFTLIELLVVVGVLAIISVGLVIAIDPADKLNQASDSRVISDLGAMARAIEAYTVANNGAYPLNLGNLVVVGGGGELKVLPIPPSNYCGSGSSGSYTTAPCAFTASLNLTPPQAQAACAAGTCKSVILVAPLKSKKYTNASPAKNFWKYESSTGKSCPVNASTDNCP